MARRKIPQEAFSLYQSLGTERSYQVVANHYGVTKRAVVNCARRERWQERLLAAQTREREETIESVNDRNLRCLRAIQTKAIEALKRLEFENAADALEALELAIKGERTILGLPTEIHAHVLEDAVPGGYEPQFLNMPWPPRGEEKIEHGGEETAGKEAKHADDEDPQQAPPLP